MRPYDFEQSVGYWLTITTQTYHRAVIEELAPHGITYRQMQVIAWLVIDGDTAQNELASKMIVEPPTLVGVLDRMERAGWISRRQCPDDRRKKLIHLEPEAESLWHKVVDCAIRMRQRATAGLSASEIETLRDLLGRVRSNLTEEALVASDR